MGQKTVIGASGEYSDFAYIMTLLEEITTDDYCRDDGETLTPKEVRVALSMNSPGASSGAQHIGAKRSMVRCCDSPRAR
mgnify:CR=1 FL=1